MEHYQDCNDHGDIQHVPREGPPAQVTPNKPPLATKITGHRMVTRTSLKSPSPSSKKVTVAPISPPLATKTIRSEKKSPKKKQDNSLFFAYVDTVTQEIVQVITPQTSNKELGVVFREQQKGRSLEFVRVRQEQRKKTKRNDDDNTTTTTEGSNDDTKIEYTLIPKPQKPIKKWEIPDFRALARESSDQDDECMRTPSIAKLLKLLQTAHQEYSQLAEGSNKKPECNERHQKPDSTELPATEQTDVIVIEDDVEDPKKSFFQPRNRKRKRSTDKAAASKTTNAQELVPYPGFLKHRAQRLANIQFPMYVTDPTKHSHLFPLAYHAIGQILPSVDREDMWPISVAQHYYDYWKPKDVRVILLAESHVFTHTDSNTTGPQLRQDLAKKLDYHGPRDYVSLVYCLTYGEREALSSAPSAATTNGDDETSTCPIYNSSARGGTPQFWSLLAACLRQDPRQFAKSGTPRKHQSTKRKPQRESLHSAAQDSEQVLLERLKQKLALLQALKDAGIWLLDTSIVGWYRTQEQQYTISKESLQMHKMRFSRPPPNLKAPTLVLSWEVYMKHVIRTAAEEGKLKLLIPIGREVEKAITKERLEEACRCGRGGASTTRVVDAFPAPNAWCKGGYGPILNEFGDLVTSCLTGEPVDIIS